MLWVRTGQGEELLSLQDFEARVRVGEIAPNTPVRFPVLTGEHWVDAGDLELFRRLYEPARIHFTRAFTLGKFPVLTVLFVAIQVLIFFGVAGANRAIALDPLIEAGAKVPANVLELGQTWRLLTANVLHRDVMHLLFNMFFLFNVGSTIENAYRKQDYLLVLVASALGTTLLSTLMSPLPSVGASGIVLGLFGAATIFGYKYADILPRRYRRYLTGAILPYALFVLYVGLATPQTDNWGHLGGFIGGLLSAILLEPRLLRLGKPKRTWVIDNAPVVVTAGLVAILVAAGLSIRAAEPRLTELVDRDSGLRVVYPPRWEFGQNHLGYASWGNSLGASIGLRAHREVRKPETLNDLRKRLVDQALAARASSGHVTSVRVLEERAARIEGARAIELRIALDTRAGPLETRNLIIERGYYSYYVVLSAPARWAREYDRVFDRMVREVRLVEPARVERARRVVSTFPGMSSAHVDLGDELASIGEVSSAAASYKQALAALPEYADGLYGLAKLAADFGGDLDSAEAIAARLHAQKPDAPSVAALLCDIRERLGQIDGARAVLLETLHRAPEANELRARLMRLRSAGSVDRTRTR